MDVYVNLDCKFGITMKRQDHKEHKHFIFIGDLHRRNIFLLCVYFCFLSLSLLCAQN